MTFDDKTTADALSFLRVVVATAEEVDLIRSRVGSAAARASMPVRPLCVRNECAALDYLAMLMGAQLKGYPTTMVEDDALLPTLEPFSNRRNCVIVVRGEKEVSEGAGSVVALVFLPERDDDAFR
jgi:hypothetical protein